MTILSEDINKPWLKETLKDIENLIDNQTILFIDPEKGHPVTPCMDVYKRKIQSDESLDNLQFRIVVGGDLQNKERIGDTWLPTTFMRNLK